MYKSNLNVSQRNMCSIKIYLVNIQSIIYKSPIRNLIPLGRATTHQVFDFLKRYLQMNKKYINEFKDILMLLVFK